MPNGCDKTAHLLPFSLLGVREWAEKLFCQIRGLGAIPINFEKNEIE
jgi:hypothetical protein